LKTNFPQLVSIAVRARPIRPILALFFHRCGFVMTSRFWRLYLLAWFPVVAILSLASQSGTMASGGLDATRLLVSAASMVPGILALALVWPLTARLAASERSPVTIAAIHFGLAVLYGIGEQGMDYLIRLLKHAPNKMNISYMIWPFLFSLMMYAMVAAIFHTIRATDAARRQSMATVQAQGLVVVSELAALRNKLNPHFLFNTLHSIIALTRKNSGAAEEALLKFSDMLRYVLDTEKSGSDRVTLEEELAFVRDYLDLEALRLGPRLTVQWDLEEHAGCYCVPALSVQPLVENSIKYAFNPRSQPGRLVIRTRCDPAAGQATITVRDDGPGATPEQLAASTGLGVKTVERRLHLEYRQRASFKIDTAPGEGFAVTLTIPLEVS
jgi:signal transduction histidine kinase